MTQHKLKEITNTYSIYKKKSA